MVLENVSLKGLRNAMCKKPKDVAKALGISVSSYNNKENGRNKIWIYPEGKQLAKFYGCTLKEICEAAEITAKDFAKKQKSSKKHK